MEEVIVRKEVVIKSSLKALGLDNSCCNYKALDLFVMYQSDVEYIRYFIEKLFKELEESSSLSLLEIKQKFDVLNEENWHIIDSYAFKESEYYIFLRLKVFLLTIDLASDLKEDAEWFEFFKDKYIQYMQ